MDRIGLVALAALPLLAACTPTETLFQSNFNSTAIGSPPAPTQAVGTANWFGPGGSVVIAAPQPGATDRWLHIARATNDAPIAGMTGTLSQLRPPGTFHFSDAMLMPSNAGLATLEFDALNPAGGNGSRFEFMHMDFLQDNHVRLDDIGSTEFGSFPRDTPFDVFVTLNTSASPPTATISLVGGGATGTVTYTIRSPSPAQQFDAVTLWMGYPWTGSFQSGDVVVTHDTQ